jgi:hypothetical protein
MGLLEALKDESNFPKKKGTYCAVCHLLDTLDVKERDLLQARLSMTAVSHSSLSLVLRNNGFDVSDSTVGRHRRKVCGGVLKK